MIFICGYNEKYGQKSNSVLTTMQTSAEACICWFKDTTVNNVQTWNWSNILIYFNRWFLFQDMVIQMKAFSPSDVIEKN